MSAQPWERHRFFDLRIISMRPDAPRSAALTVEVRMTIRHRWRGIIAATRSVESPLWLQVYGVIRSLPWVLFGGVHPGSIA